MTRYLKTAFAAAAALLAASCISNDIPYPVVELRIANVEGEGFSVSENNVTSRVVTLTLDEATDIRNVKIDAVTYDAVVHSIELNKAELLDQVRSSQELTGTFNLLSPIYTTLSLYQDYDWTIRAVQTIERRFSVTGQIGATEIDTENRIVRVYVPDDTDLGHIEIEELKLGPAEITTYSPSLEELSGVVWAAAGINRPGTDRLTAPSALALYPVRVYAFFAEGVYRYDARTHKLVRVLEGDRRKLTGMQDFVFAAPLNLVYLADRTVYEGRNIPAEHVRYLCGQDAAGYAENVNLYTAGHGLRSITRGSVPEAELLAALGLEPARWFVALAQTVGK